MQLPEIDSLVTIVKNAANLHLMPLFGNTSRTYKQDNSIVTAADLASQQYIHQELKQHWPEFEFLAEEMTAEQQQQLMNKPGQGLWIVDPIDGTSNFSAGIPYFAISIALMIDRKIVLGIVYDPNRDEAFSATSTPDNDTGTCMLNGKPLIQSPSPEKLSQSIAGIDFKRLPADLSNQIVSNIPYSSQRSFGSVALDWCWLAANRFHVYLHGRSNIWDYAAGLLIFEKAGGHSCTLQGESIYVPHVEPRSSVAALNPSHFKEWTTFLGIPYSQA